MDEIMEEKNNVNQQNEDILPSASVDLGNGTPDVLNEPAQADENEKKCREYLELAQRVQADFENFKRRNANVRMEAFQQGCISAVMAFLPVVDNLERALKASLEAGGENKLLEGVQMVYKQMLDALNALGVEEIPALGEAFDPNLHEAVMREQADDPGQAGKVTDTMLKGYRLNDRVLRCAMVKVAQ